MSQSWRQKQDIIRWSSKHLYIWAHSQVSISYGVVCKNFSCNSVGFLENTLAIAIGDDGVLMMLLQLNSTNRKTSSVFFSELVFEL